MSYGKSARDGSELPVHPTPPQGNLAKEVTMAKALKTSNEGRKCKHPDCRRTLSIYNHEAYCRRHLEQSLSQEKNKPYRHACK
ncbi:MAG: hypothetical protein ACYSOF_07675 [Planctomycetota bacterium]